MISAANIIISILIALWFLRKARATGKDPARWALTGWAVYFVPASLLTGLLLWVWLRSFLQALIPLEVHFFKTGFLSAFFGVLVPAAGLGLVVSLHVYSTFLGSEAARRMNGRSYAFEAVALVLVAVGWLARPGLPGAGGARATGHPLLFPRFN